MNNTFKIKLTLEIDDKPTGFDGDMTIDALDFYDFNTELHDLLMRYARADVAIT